MTSAAGQGAVWGWMGLTAVVLSLLVVVGCSSEDDSGGPGTGNSGVGASNTGTGGSGGVTFTGAGASAGFGAGAGTAGGDCSGILPATIRDFQIAHPDFQTFRLLERHGYDEGAAVDPKVPRHAKRQAHHPERVLDHEIGGLDGQAARANHRCQLPRIHPAELGDAPDALAQAQAAKARNSRMILSHFSNRAPRHEAPGATGQESSGWLRHAPPTAVQAAIVGIPQRAGPYAQLPWKLYEMRDVGL